MRLLLSLLLISFIFLSIAERPQAFDDTTSIEPSHHVQENFLDLKEYQFHKLQEERWYESQNGWRTSGGSISVDLLYHYLEIKFRKNLRSWISTGFHLRQEEFFKITPARFLVDVELRPLNWFGVSLLGMQEYDKRHADQGIGVTLGERPWDFIYFQHLSHDLYYNEKNFYDQSYYLSNPVEHTFETGWSFGNWKFRTRAVNDSKVHQYFPEKDLNFTYQGREHQGVLDYHFGDKFLTGISWNFFEHHKKRETGTSSLDDDNRQQRMIYYSWDYYWLQPLDETWHGTLGMREDRIENKLIQFGDDSASSDFHLWTLQLYGTLIQRNQPDSAWEYGLYLGDTEKGTDYLAPSTKDLLVRKYESSLKISWIMNDLSQDSELMFTSSWNLDDRIISFSSLWDGGHISYQQVF